VNQENKTYQCPVCGSSDVRDFVMIQDVPVHCNLLWPDRDEALSAPKGDIVLVSCASCGHIFNRAFDPALTEYTQAYENSLDFSPRFQEYAVTLASGLVERHDLRGCRLVEIGSGQGGFLRLMCDIGDNQGTGFDEAYVPSAADEEDERLTFIAEFAWQEHIEEAPDMIYARHVLEHIEKPADFIAVIREVIGEADNTLLFLEMPNAAYMLRELAIWDILYEHCGYYSPQSISCLLTRGGFETPATDAVFGGQFLTAETRPAARASDSGCVSEDELREMNTQVDAFAGEFSSKIDHWRRRLAGWHDEGKRIAAWGAGTKGVMFLNFLRAGDQIPCIVDINPRKSGMYIVGTGQRIVPPEFLTDFQPEIVILMNAIYRDEIANMLEELGVSAEIVVA